MTAKAQKISERRLNELCVEWQKQMQEIPDDLVDKDYVESEEFFDLVFKTWEATKRTRHNEKIHLYARILTGAVPIQNREEHPPEDYLTVLEELSPTEIKLARALYEQQKEQPEDDENGMKYLRRKGVLKYDVSETNYVKHGHGQWAGLIQKCPDVTQSNIEFALLRLQRCGIANEITGAFLDYTGGVYCITETFRKMMEFLEKNSD
jgi:hypothetical protein